MRTRLMRRGSASRIWNSKPGSACTTSPRTGMRPSAEKMRPPSVSTSSTCSAMSKSGPIAAAISSSSTRASATKTSSETRLNITSSSSCSSSMSPTTISTMSSCEARPSVPPYSSITSAICVRLTCIRRRRSEASIDGGTNRILRMMPASTSVFCRSTRERSKFGFAERVGFSVTDAAVVAAAVFVLLPRRLLRACLAT